MIFVWAAPPTLDTEIPTLIAGLIPELNKSVNIKLSVKAIKIVDKLGLIPYLKKQGLTLADIT